MSSTTPEIFNSGSDFVLSKFRFRMIVKLKLIGAKISSKLFEESMSTKKIFVATTVPASPPQMCFQNYQPHSKIIFWNWMGMSFENRGWKVAADRSGINWPLKSWTHLCGAAIYSHEQNSDQIWPVTPTLKPDRWSGQLRKSKMRDFLHEIC